MNISQLETAEIKQFRLGGFIAAFIVISAIFLVSPWFAEHLYAFMLMQCGFVGLILAIIYSVKTRHAILIPGLCVTLLFIFFDYLSITRESVIFLTIAYAIYVLFTFVAIVFLIQKVFTAPVVDTNLIFGALIIYLLTGILWSKVYFVLDILIPGSFEISHFELEKHRFKYFYHLQFNLIYFSFTTLATLGLGDIAPVHHLAKSLTAMEAIFGQLFVAVIIAKVVSVWKHQRSPHNITHHQM